MGHYVNIIHEKNRYFVAEGVDTDKRSVVFSGGGLHQQQLARIVFLWVVSTNEVRKMAADHWIPESIRKTVLVLVFVPLIIVLF